MYRDVLPFYTKRCNVTIGNQSLDIVNRKYEWAMKARTTCMYSSISSSSWLKYIISQSAPKDDVNYPHMEMKLNTPNSWKCKYTTLQIKTIYSRQCFRKRRDCRVNLTRRPGRQTVLWIASSSAYEAGRNLIVLGCSAVLHKTVQRHDWQPMPGHYKHEIWMGHEGSSHMHVFFHQL